MSIRAGYCKSSEIPRKKKKHNHCVGGEEAVFLAQKQPPSWSEKFPSFVAVLRWDPKRSSVVKPYTSNVHPKEPGRQGKIKDEKNCHGGKFDLKKTRNLCHLFLLIHLKATKKNIYMCIYGLQYKLQNLKVGILLLFTHPPNS